MRRPLLLLLLLLAGCSKGPQADLQYVGEARSAAAEWALVNEQASRGQLTAAYVQTMRKSLRQQIESSRSALTVPDSAYAREMGALLGAPDDAPPAELRAHSERLKQIEDHLESA
jgi:hypothetical protein